MQKLLNDKKLKILVSGSDNERGLSYRLNNKEIPDAQELEEEFERE